MRMRIAVLALAVLALGGQAQAAGPPPLHVLFVGNSLTATNDLPGMVVALGKGSRFRDVEVRTIAPGGWSLEDHWRLGEAPRLLASQHWDAIVLQQGPSALPESQVNLREWAERLAAEARERGTRPALFTVWPESYRFAVFPDVLASYRNAARAARAELFPAGDAWRAAWRRDPKLPLTGRTASTRADSGAISLRS